MIQDLEFEKIKVTAKLVPKKSGFKTVPVILLGSIRLVWPSKLRKSLQKASEILDGSISLSLVI